MTDKTLLYTINVERFLTSEGDLETRYTLSDGVTYYDAIAMLELAKLKIHNELMFGKSKYED